MKILVLGSEGQIGKPTCEYLEEMGYEVIRYDKVRSPYEDLTGNFSNLLNAISKSDFVYYFASNVGGAKYLEKHQDSIHFISDNMTIMRNVFSILQWTGKPFIFTSSQMAELSHSTYGLLKLLGERMTKNAGGLVVRLWNVYGPEHDEEKSHVITDFCKMAKMDGVIKMRTDGEESRQFLHAKDCAECLLTLTQQYDILDKEQNYHITSFDWVKIKDIAKYIQNITGCEIIYGDRKDETQMNAMNEPDQYILNFWKPKTDIETGIRKILTDE